MKTLLACALGASFLGTAVVCAMAGEQPTLPAATIYVGPAAITLPASVLVQAPVTANPHAPRTAEAPTQPRPVRVVLASPYAVR